VQWVDHRLARWLPTVLAPLLLAIPTYPFLLIMLSTGIGTPFSVLLPFPIAILLPELNFYGFYLIYFLFGWILHRQTHLLSNVARQWSRWMGLGAGCFLIAYFITKGLDFNPWQDGFWQRRFSGLAFYSVATAAFCLGFTGLFHRNFNRDSKSWRFLSNASYWIYLSHLPLVFMASAIVARWPMAWGWKLLLTTACVTGICVMTYILFVRNRWLGKMLDSSPPN
jgi:peptidoglycan/LPS O-acetylase OafA/YrhL